MSLKLDAERRPALQLWVGLECTLNRVGDAQHDQLAFSGHYHRPDDIERIAALGVRTLRYPILWERLAGRSDDDPRWLWHDERLERMRRLGLDPILGLVHHGSGPRDTNLLDDGFAEGLAPFARTVAARYPWVTRFTPVNEPLTTARFSALYGLWYPHVRDDASCMRAVLNQVRATRLAMSGIRVITPHAELVQTEDLGKTHSTPPLRYQADFENERRWLTYDLLMGRVTRGHRMYEHAQSLGITEGEIARAVGEGCPPAIIGVNHYVTSERWLDERLELYPPDSHGGNHRQRYADVEAVRARPEGAAGIEALLREAWQRYAVPLAVTEVHMGCTREHQLRWLDEAWDAASVLRDDGVPILAVTAWGLLGAFDWASLLTHVDGQYEPGLFDVRSPQPRATALAQMAHGLAVDGGYDHPALDEPGWWRRGDRLIYGSAGVGRPSARPGASTMVFPRTILVTGASGTLGTAFTRLCGERGLTVRAVPRSELDVTNNAALEKMLRETRAWAIVNAAGYVEVDAAESDRHHCHRANVTGASNVAEVCAHYGIKCVTFSSDLVFDGRKSTPYVEGDQPSPLNTYGTTKAEGERRVLELYPNALVVRSAAFFGVWDSASFLTRAMRELAAGMPFLAADDVTVSPTFVPDLVNTTLDLLIDGERGVWHLANAGAVTWAELARHTARMAGLDASLVGACSHHECGMIARRPRFSALASERGNIMPSLEDALGRYVAQRPWALQSGRMARSRAV